MLSQYSDVVGRVESHIDELKKQKTILEYQYSDLNKALQVLVDQKDSIFKEMELMKMTSLYLQDLIASVSDKNITKVETLVNAALATVFTDMNLTFKIEKVTKRNQLVYQLNLYEDGELGGTDSNGGGTIAMVCAILFILSNRLAKRYPFIAFDESLSFLSVKYVQNAARFLKEISEELDVEMLLSTHQAEFLNYADRVYRIEKNKDDSSSLELMVGNV